MRIGSAARREQRARASPADARSRVTDGAVSLGVTAHARVQVALRFPGVVHGRAGWVGPEPPGAARVRVGRVKAAAPGKRRIRTGFGHSGALMAADAERLQAVTARAVRIELAGRDFVHADPVIRMHFSVPHAAVVTLDTIVFGVAARAKLTVGAGYAFVPLDPIGAVPGIVQPARR